MAARRIEEEGDRYSRRARIPAGSFVTVEEREVKDPATRMGPVLKRGGRGIAEFRSAAKYTAATTSANIAPPGHSTSRGYG